MERIIGNNDVPTLIGICVGMMSRPGANPGDACGVIDIRTVAAVVILFEIIITVGLQQNYTVMLSIGGPTGLTGIAFGIVVGKVVNVIYAQAALWY